MLTDFREAGEKERGERETSIGCLPDAPCRGIEHAT